MRDKNFGSGSKTVVVEVKAEGQLVTFTVKTDKESVGAALMEHKIIEGEEGRLQFRFPKDQDVVFEHTGYGEFTIRKEVTFIIQKGERETEEITGPVYFHFKRVSYFTE